MWPTPFTLYTQSSPAVEAHFVSSKMDVVVFKHLLTNFTEQAFQECPSAVRQGVDRTIGAARGTAINTL